MPPASGVSGSLCGLRLRSIGIETVLILGNIYFANRLHSAKLE